MNNRDQYGIDVGDLVRHVKESSWTGIVTEINDNLNDVTTCRVAWDDNHDHALTLEETLTLPRENTDIQWTNKLVRIQ